MTSTSTWPTEKAQQKICKRRDTMMCAAAGALGCELCTPCAYADDALAARGLPVEELRANHARLFEGRPQVHVCPPAATAS